MRRGDHSPVGQAQAGDSVTLPARALASAVLAYQHMAATRPSACRYVPSCSTYALDALEAHGAGRGAWLAFRRLCRCHPWAGSGLDPVPEADAGPSSLGRR